MGELHFISTAAENYYLEQQPNELELFKELSIADKLELMAAKEQVVWFAEKKVYLGEDTINDDDLLVVESLRTRYDMTSEDFQVALALAEQDVRGRGESYNY
jgi:hypothetical protein